ncbi:hypothetical protein K504DRAFT_519727 [Pleomassaria siparia CBS 279.74]|uniref:Uncharacterized protein n=1 Tax=Pleomassaria siparia CBS 279.74 TaxID=1314801 RepID=A0A6G1JTH9_9PLEO|nr:hypothetical protein K504DRAFT_519727 [Pleomassaria siparia CBS 279.74]
MFPHNNCEPGLSRAQGDNWGVQAPDGAPFGQDNIITSTARTNGVSLSTVAALEAEQVDALIIYLAEERNNPTAFPGRPRFLNGLPVYSEDPRGYQETTLPYVASLTFVITCGPDATFFKEVVQSDTFPGIDTAVLKLSFPNFHWFSGVINNRTNNPWLALCATLPNLEEVSLNFHTAGLTTSTWTERQRIRLETGGLMIQSKDLRCLRLADVVRKYDIDRLFQVRTLRKVHLTCWDSQIVKFHVNNGDPLRCFRELESYIISGFYDIGSRVDAEMSVQSAPVLSITQG